MTLLLIHSPSRQCTKKNLFCIYAECLCSHMLPHWVYCEGITTIRILLYSSTHRSSSLSLFVLTWAFCWAAASWHQPVSVSAADVRSVWRNNKKRWLWVSTHTPLPRHAVTCVSTEDLHCKTQASQKRESNQSVSMWEPTHRQRLRWDLHRNAPSTWPQKWEHVMFYLLDSLEICQL